MRRQGNRLVGMSDSFCSWKAGWTLVSVFTSHYLCAGLTRHSQCVGETPDGEDFEAFIGAEKALEFKTLFSSWIYKIYRKCIIRESLILILISLPHQPCPNGVSLLLAHRQD